MAVKVGPKIEKLDTSCGLKIWSLQNPLCIICKSMATTLVKISVESDVLSLIYCPQTSQIKHGYLKGKTENDKFPEAKTCGAKNFGWMVLLYAMWESVLTLWLDPRGQFRPIFCPKKGFLFNFTRVLWFFSYWAM